MILGIFLSLSNNLQYVARQLSQDIAVFVYLDKNPKNEQVREIEETLKSSSLVSRIQYISSEKALERFGEKFPELKGIIENLRMNPFPPSFEISIEDQSVTPGEIQSFIQDIRKSEDVEDVQFSQEWVEKVRSVSRLIKAIGFFFGGILIFASFFIISNVIKLNVFARKEEIEILRLIGATNSFIRIPFLTEGIILGIFGGIISLLLLLVLIKIFPFYLGSSLGALQDLINFRYLSVSQSLILIAGGAIIGCLGSLSSLARFLKEHKS